MQLEFAYEMHFEGIINDLFFIRKPNSANKLQARILLSFGLFGIKKNDCQVIQNLK